jgi:hypothetical protein
VRKQSTPAGEAPWNTPRFAAAHPELGAAERALAWLRETFGRRSF